MFNDSLDNLKESIKIDSNDHETFFYLGGVYVKLENIEEAIKSYEQSIKLKPKNIFSLYNLGELFYKLGKNEDALKYLDKVLTIDNKYEDADKLKNLIKKFSNDNQIKIENSSDNNQIRNNIDKTKNIDDVRLINDKLVLKEEKNLISLEEYKFIFSKIGDQKIITLLYAATYHGFSLEEFFLYTNKKNNILLLVTLNDGERFGFVSDQGFEKGQDLRNNKNMSMFNLTKKEFKHKTDNDTHNWVRSNNQSEYVNIGFQCKKSKMYYSILFVSNSNKNNQINCFNNDIYFSTSSSYYKSFFTITQIELYQMSD